MKRSIIIGAIVAALGALSFGTAMADEGDARVRVLHASPDAPAVDVYVNGSEAISDLAFSDITGYIELAPGDYDVAVYPAEANGSGDPVISATLTLSGSTDYTVAAVGELAAIEPLVLVDDNSRPAEGQAHVRFVHLSPDAPAVDIAAAGVGVVIPNAAFKDASAYLPLPAGSYDLDVLVSGTETSALALPGVTVEAGKVYTAFALGFAEGEPALTAKLVTDATYDAAAPHAPTAGSGGLAATGGDSNMQWLGLLGIAALAVTGIGAAAAVRRARQ